MPLALDHALILHDDLDAAEAATRRLGFAPTPRGHHGQGMGTANVTVMMPDCKTYFEQLAVTEPTPRNADKRERLAARGRHLYGAAFKGDARAEAARFAALGVGAGEAFDFSRPVDLPGGAQEARFAIAMLAPGALPGLYAFVCQQFTPHVVWRPDFLDHPNGARAVAGLWGVAPDPAALAAAWRRLVGDAAVLTAEGLEVSAGTARFTYLRPEIWAARFGPSPAGDGPQLLALHVFTGPRARLEAVWRAGGVAWRETAAGLHAPDPGGFGADLIASPT